MVQKVCALAKDQDLEIFPDPFLAFTPPQDQVIFEKEHVHLFPVDEEVIFLMGFL